MAHDSEKRIGPLRARALSAPLAAVLGAALLLAPPATTDPGGVTPDAPTASLPDAARAVDWPLHGLTPHETRYSPLDQIDRESVSRLGLAWSYATGSDRGLEATPLVVGGVLYATGSWSIVFALDARTGRELWRHDPKVPGWKARHACCGVVNRGVAYARLGDDARVFVGTLDGRLHAHRPDTARDAIH